MIIDGHWCDDKATISTHAIEYFKTLYATCPTNMEMATLLQDVIPHLISDSNNNFLVSTPNGEEVRNVVFSYRSF